MSSIFGQFSSSQRGFTITELMAVVVVLALMVVVSARWIDTALIASTKSGRDSERRSDMQAVAALFEQYYQSTPSALGSTYPTTNQVNSSLSALVSNSELVTPPSGSTPAFSSAADVDPQTPSFEEYIYQPFTAAGNLCLVAPCVRFTIYYGIEASSEIRTIESSHQQ